MKTLRSVVFLTIILAGAALGESLFTGTWQGKMGDLPYVTLTVTEDGGKLSGVVDFYLLTRPTENDPWQIDSKFSTPLIGPKVDGKVLSFEVRHQKSHNSKS